MTTATSANCPGFIARKKRQQKQKPANLSSVESEREFTVELPQDGVRVDLFVLERTPWLSRTKAKEAFAEGRVLKNGQQRGRGQESLRTGDKVVLVLPPPHEDITEMGRIPFDMVYEDDGMLVVSKPPHLIVHPTGGYRYTTLLNALHLRYTVGRAQGHRRSCRAS
jgi:23S rRNA pseudouridine1911/1915/1917 synthase